MMNNKKKSSAALLKAAERMASNSSIVLWGETKLPENVKRMMEAKKSAGNK